MTWTTPRTWVAAEVVTAALMNTHVRDNFDAIGDAWGSYTPSVSGWSLGNGTVVGRYMRAGKLVHVYVKLTVGSTTTFGTLTLGLPVTSRVGTWFPAGGIACKDAGASNPRAMSAVLTSTTEFGGFNEAGGALNASVPFTWATSDTIDAMLTYEGA